MSVQPAKVVCDGALRKYYYKSGSNLAGDFVLPMNGSRMRLLTITLTYKTVSTSGGVDSYAAASVSKTCTVTLDSGAGPEYDALLQTISLSSASAGQWAPQEVQVFCGDDALVIAPAASGTVSVISTIEVTMMVDEVV